MLIMKGPEQLRKRPQEREYSFLSVKAALWVEGRPFSTQQLSMPDALRVNACQQSLLAKHLWKFTL
jgi:hypothetical protein